MIYATITGGIGDAILQATEPGGDFGYLESFKQHWPEVGTLLHLWCATSGMQDLFWEQPGVDRIRLHEFSPEYQSHIVEGRPMREDERKFGWRRPIWRLDQTEQMLVRSIAGAGPYVAYHPYAADDIRGWRANGLEPDRAALVMLPRRVVLLGGNAIRWTPEGPITLSDDFAFGYPHRLVVDMRGSASLRVQVELVRQASCFVGAASAFMCAALTYHVPSLVYTTPKFRQLVEDSQGRIFGMMRRHCTSLSYFDAMPEEPYEAIRRFTGIYA